MKTPVRRRQKFRSESYVHNENPEHPESWVVKKDSNNNDISLTFGQDPTHPNSWEAVYYSD